ncbi:helix-turn-helix domain-containing protein [Pseudomonas sp. GCM10022186]|uniref:helix-turn-helix domain-containing protein n=1 Tax=Pseudomonas sp. GCM10022186 TaxID=3252650 RepID=UPI003623E492
MNTTEIPEPRLLTKAELGLLVKHYREMRKWSQETLASIAKVTPRTVQRVEAGSGASPDTLRALANAFDFEDIDLFNKPYPILSDDELKAVKEKFEKDFVTLKAHPVTTGRQLAKLAEESAADLIEPAFEMNREAVETFAQLADYLREFRDCADVYSETSKLEVYDELQSHISLLSEQGVGLRYATRKLNFSWKSDADGQRAIPVTVLYVIGFQLGEEPDEFVTPRSARLGV